MSKIICKPKLMESLIRIGPVDETAEIKTVPESQYRELERNVENLKQESYQLGLREGRQSGYDQGLTEGRAQARELTDRIQPILSEIVRQKNEIYLTAEKDILDLALLIGKKIVGSAVASYRELILDTIKKSLPLLLEKSRLTIKVSPEEEQFLKDNLDNILALDRDLKEIRIEADRRVSIGGCILETSSGRVNAQIDHQLEALIDALEKQIPSPENI